MNKQVVFGILIAAAALVAGCSAASVLPGAAILPAPLAQATATPAQPEQQATPTGLPAVQNGVIVGQLVNGTPGASIPASLPVTLYALSSSLETVTFTQTAQTDANGQALFTGLYAEPGTMFAVVVEYQHAVYFNEPQHFPTSQTTMTLPVTIYESTTDPSAVRVEQMHILLDVQPGSVQVGELLVASNSGDRAFVDEQGGSLRMTLPAGATGLQFEDGEMGGRYMPAGDGFVDTEAVRPGQGTYQTMFSFILPYDGKSLDVDLPIPYPVQNINVLLPDVGVELSSPQLAAGDSMQAQGVTYLNFAGTGSLAAGQSLSLRLAGAVKSAGAPAAAASSNYVMWGLAGALLAGAVLTGVYAWRRSRREGDADEFVEEGEEEPADKETLLDEIAALDDAYEAGQIAESDYQREREELKSELAEIMQAERAQ